MNNEQHRRDFGKRLRALRSEAGMSRDEVAERAGISPETIARLERGERNPSLFLAHRLANSFGTTVDDLLNHHRSPTANSQDVDSIVRSLKRMSAEQIAVALVVVRALETAEDLKK